MNRTQSESKAALAVSVAYVCWGLLTIFWNLLARVDSLYILSQRVLWSTVVIGGYAVLIGKWPDIKRQFHSCRSLAHLFLCGALISVNWGVYIYAVNNGHVLDASLGYFVEPVLVTFLGMLCFKERLNRREKITFAFAVAGLVYITVMTGTVPVLAVVIAGSFAVYGALKKRTDVDPYVSLGVETLLMAPFALAYALWADVGGLGAVGVLNGWEWLLLPACGAVTGIPLLLFNIGVQKIPYYVSGLLMYLNPTIAFLMGLFYFKEELNVHRLIAFCIIWIGIGFTVWDRLSAMRIARKAALAGEANHGSV